MWLKDLYKLEGLLKHVDDPAFQKKWAVVKQSNKERLANYIQNTLGYKVNTRAMFDVQVKVRVLCACSETIWIDERAAQRLHEYKVCDSRYNRLIAP